MVEIQFGLMMRARFPHNRIDTIQRQTEVYRRALDEYGKPFPREFPARREVFVARSREEAIRVCDAILRLHRATGINHLGLHMLAEEVTPKVRRG